LPANHSGACPNCGSEAGRTINLSVFDSLVASESEPVRIELISIREFYERNPIALGIVVLITIFSSCVGLLLSGFLGVVVGLVLGVITFFLGARAVIKVREIRRE
jgi:hypothetical protein